jgi:type I restriction enzyme M protein
MPKRHRPGASASSLLRHVEEIVLATSGEDAFEVVFAVAAAALAGKDAPSGSAARLRRAMRAVAARHPILEVDTVPQVPDELLLRVDALLRRSLAVSRYTTLDAVFESLVPRVSKSDKGQFFTPRHVVEFVVRMLDPKEGEVLLDPACGSGAFLAQGRASARIRAVGADVDARAVRVARLLTLASGDGDPKQILRADGLQTEDLPLADVVATNPPFAGRASAAAQRGFAVAELVRSPERDVLFLERALRLLRAKGRLGIVLPYNKANGEAFAAVRRWLVEHARVFAVVGLPRETFLPHTSQRTFVLFAKKRRRSVPFDGADGAERTLFAVSERAGKDSGGEPVVVDGRLDHDLAEVSRGLAPFLASEGFYA